MRKYLFLALLGVSFLLFLGMFLSKSKIEFLLRPQCLIGIKIPPFSSIINRTTDLYLNDNGKYLLFGKILHGPFDRPLYFTVNKENGELYCLYDYDISTELLVFSINHKATNITPKQFGMIRSSNWIVRAGSKVDLAFVKEDINKSTADDFLFKSVPTIEIGFFRQFLSKEQLFGILDRVPSAL